MAGPNHRIAASPLPLRLRLQLVFARASEALAETYQQQAAEFVRRLKTRLTVDEALQRFFREVGVPAALEETVRARALISLSGLIENPPGRNPGHELDRPAAGSAAPGAPAAGSVCRGDQPGLPAGRIDLG